MRIRILFFLCTGLCLTAGCSKNTGPAPVMPQNTLSPVTENTINSENVSSNAIVTTEESSVNKTPEQTKSEEAKDYADMTQDELLQSYYQVKAEEKALETEEDQLKSNFRIGNIEETAFQEQKLYLAQLDKALELEEDTLELYLKQMNFTEEEALSQDIKDILASGDRQKIYSLYQTLEIEEDHLELEEDTLENQYLTNKVTREEFITKQAELEKREFLLECQLDYLEDLGYDD